MGMYYKYLIFIVSFLFFTLIILTSYLLGKKWGIKKALYRITYTSTCVIFAFLLTPYINEYILNYDLYSRGRAIRYNGLHFYRIIDFIEEVIVHNDVLNDLYNLLPNLKNLLMDFPQLLFAPITYALLFIIFKIIFLPVYLYLSYKRKRRVLYEKKISRDSKIWAGTLTAVHSIFLFSIVLTPVSGLTRIYKETRKEVIDTGNLCSESVYLEKYEKACAIIEAYNSSVFGLISSSPVNQYVYDSLTRINYNNEESNLRKEVVNIAKAGLILNKTGLLNVVTVENFNDISQLNFKAMTREDIDIIIYAFESSLYAREVVYDVYEWSKVYLEWVITDIVNLECEVSYTYEEIIQELKVVLTMINYVMNNTSYLGNIREIYNIINDFMQLPIKERVKEENGLKLFFDLAHTLDVESTKTLITTFKDSKIFSEYAIKVLEQLLEGEGIIFNGSKNPEEIYQVIIYGLNIVKIIQNHLNTRDILELVSSLSIEEIHYIAGLCSYLSESESMKDFLYSMVNSILKSEKIELDIPTEVLYEIKDWNKELELVQLVIQIVNTQEKEGYIDYDKAWYGLTNYSNTILFKKAFNYAIKLLPKVFTAWIAGKDYKYLVGEYA